MAKFKKGDRVRAVHTGALGWESQDWCACAYDDSGLQYPGGVATVSDVDNDGDVRIEDSSFRIAGDHFELVEGKPSLKAYRTDWASLYADFIAPELNTAVIKPKKPFMTTVNTMMKKLLDADTRALIEAGYLDSELNITTPAKEQLWAIIFEANKADLVALAKAELEEKK